MSKKHKKRAFSLRSTFYDKDLHSWQLGLTIALYNALIMTGIGILSVLTIFMFPFWLYSFILAPAVFILVWLRSSQVILHHYKRIKLHDALMIAKYSIFPFLLSFVIALLFYTRAVVSDGVITDSLSGLIAYYTMLFSVGSIFLGLTVMVFGLRHRIAFIHIQD